MKALNKDSIDSILKAIDTLCKELPEVDNSLIFRDLVAIKYKNRVLNELKACVQGNREYENINTALKEFFKKNWDLIRGTLLDYTATPNDDLTQLLCKLAESVASNLRENPVQMLMPSIISVESEYDSELPKLGEKDNDLQWVVKSHIVSGDGKYLLPMNPLLGFKVDTDLKKILNPYWDLLSGDSNCYLTDSELERLVDHSDLTRSVMQIRRNYESLADNNESLLGQLRQL